MTRPTRSPGRRRKPASMVLPDEESSLLDVVDHLLDRGVRLEGDVVLGLAGVDLVYLRLGTLLVAAQRLLARAGVVPGATRPRSTRAAAGSRPPGARPRRGPR